MRIVRLLIYVTLAGLFILSCGQQQGKDEKSALLTGRVTETDSTVYLTGVKVFEKSHARLSTVTDSTGLFRLDGVMFEEHNIYFEKEGYQPYTLWFEYNGQLSHPLVTRSITMKKVGESK